MEKPQKPADFEALAGKTAPNPANGLQIAGNTDPVFQTRAELVAPGTPLPWRANGSHIYGPEPQRSLVGQFLTSDGLLVKDRDYAIHAANCFPELVEVARMVVEASDLSGVSGPLGDAARAALAKAVTP